MGRQFKLSFLVRLCTACSTEGGDDCREGWKRMGMGLGAILVVFHGGISK